MAIADRIAEELRTVAPDVHSDHLPLVGRSRSNFMHDVGPQKAMPSGGLLAMGNVRNIARDLRGGLLGLTFAQRRFLAGARGVYDRTIAVGDVFALLMALVARAPATYVGTAKSIRVAPYGPMERRVLRRAGQLFVRDEATAVDLRTHGLDATAPGNVIVDLFATHDDLRANDAVAGFDPAIAIFPGSREAAYGDARHLAGIIRRVARTLPHAGAVLSVAPQLDAERFIRECASDWTVVKRDDAPLLFELRDGNRTIVRAWRGSLGPILTRVTLVVGQAGTANEAAAAAGVPVVAIERGSDRKNAWYRRRQSGLLGDALTVLSGDMEEAAAGISLLLEDSSQRARMAETGRTMMGAPGGASAIARAIAGSLKR